MCCLPLPVHPAPTFTANIAPRGMRIAAVCTRASGPTHLCVPCSHLSACVQAPSAPGCLLVAWCSLVSLQPSMKCCLSHSIARPCACCRLQSPSRTFVFLPPAPSSSFRTFHSFCSPFCRPAAILMLWNVPGAFLAGCLFTTFVSWGVFPETVSNGGLVPDKVAYAPKFTETAGSLSFHWSPNVGRVVGAFVTFLCESESKLE